MIEHLSQFIPTHGYWLTFVGALLEGETMLVLAGLAANSGYLALPKLIAIGAIGGFLGDQIVFALGRRYGARMIDRYPSLSRRAGQATRLVERFPELSIIAVRFIYGLRIIGPLTIGMSRVGWIHFATLNALGAALWSSIWLGIGYVAGSAIEASIGNLKYVERGFAGALVIAALVTVLLHLRRRRAPKPRKPRVLPAPPVRDRG